jgi:DNA processing protein
VTGTGLDTVYPSQNIKLAQQITQSGAIVTEFLPTTMPLQQHFPRRNRIVSGLSLGVVVVEAALKSGSLITANEAANQGKMVFAIPGHIYSEHHQGCHQLIREGATLVDHPEQVIEDLALPTQWQAQKQPEEALAVPSSIPTHLIALYQLLDWVGQDLDQLAQRYQASISELTAQLMELELLGLCMQQAGCYLRCRPML